MYSKVKNMQIYILKEKIRDVIKSKENDGRCVIIAEDGTEKEGYICGISSSGNYTVELFEEKIDENRNL